MKILRSESPYFDTCSVPWTKGSSANGNLEECWRTGTGIRCLHETLNELHEVKASRAKGGDDTSGSGFKSGWE